MNGPATGHPLRRRWPSSKPTAANRAKKPSAVAQPQPPMPPPPRTSITASSPLARKAPSAPSYLPGRYLRSGADAEGAGRRSAALSRTIGHSAVPVTHPEAGIGRSDGQARAALRAVVEEHAGGAVSRRPRCGASRSKHRRVAAVAHYRAVLQQVVAGRGADAGMLRRGGDAHVHRAGPPVGAVSGGSTPPRARRGAAARRNALQPAAALQG